MSLPRQFNTVTPLSKYLAMALFIIFPFMGFYLGTQYQQKIDAYSINNQTHTTIIQPTYSQMPTLNDALSNIKTNNYLDYFSISYPKEWNEHESGCFDGTKQSVTGIAIGKVIINGRTDIIICVFELSNMNNNTYSYKYSDQYVTFEANQLINGNKAHVNESTDSANDPDTPGLPTYGKQMYIVHYNYVYDVQANISLDSRSDDIETAKKLLMPEINQILSSLTPNIKN